MFLVIRDLVRRNNDRFKVSYLKFLERYCLEKKSSEYKIEKKIVCFIFVKNEKKVIIYLCFLVY